MDGVNGDTVLETGVALPTDWVCKGLTDSPDGNPPFTTGAPGDVAGGCFCSDAKISATVKLAVLGIG